MSHMSLAGRLFLTLLVVLLFVALDAGAHAEYGVSGAGSGTFTALSQEWFTTYGVTVAYLDETHYEITFAETSLASASAALSLLGATTWVSTVPGCEAYYLPDAQGIDYCVKKCGTTSTYSCVSTSCAGYQYGNFADVVNALCASCSFRSDVASYYNSSCADPFCYSGLNYRDRKLKGELTSPYYTPGGCTYGYCYYQNRDSSCPASCTNDCSAGQLRCNDSYSQTCGNYDADSCYEWPASTSGSGNSYCSYGCNATTSQCNLDSCTNECSSGQMRCNGSYSQTCGNYDADSCTEWPATTSGSGNTYCSNGCTGAGQCNAPACTNECSAGQLRCNGSYSQSCGNYDADSCYEWPSGTSGAGNTYCSYGCNAAAGQCNACTPHASYSCYSNDLYWYNSCGQREELKQDCGDSSCSAWGSNYCKSGAVYHSRSCYDKGCTGNSCYSTPRTEEQTVQDCNGNGCTNGSCNAPPLTVSVTAYTDSIENDYLGSIVWETSAGNVSETGVYVSYAADKSKAVKTAVPMNSFNRYAAILAPKYCAGSALYVRAYATGTSGATAYSDWKSISLAEYCAIQTPTEPNSGLKRILLPRYYIAQNAGSVQASSIVGPVATATCSNTSQACSADLIVFDIGGIYLAELGWEGIKLFTIGSCLDDGLLTVWCVFDVASTAGTVVAVVFPGDGPAADVAIISMKLAKLSKGNKLLSEIGTLTRFSAAVKEITLTIDGLKYTKAGSRVARAAELGAMKIDFVTNEMRTLYKELTKCVLNNGDSAVMRLRTTSSATNELLENVIKSGGKNLDEVKYLGTDLRSRVRWVETGTDKWGWQKIWKKHVTGEIPGGTKFSVVTKDLSENNIKNLIFNTLKNPTTIVKESSTKYCYFSKAVINGYRILVIADKVNALGGKGTINTAYPNKATDLGCI